MSFCTLCDLIPGLTDQHQIFYLTVKCLNPLIVSGLFIITACDQQSRTWHGADRLDRCVWISSLGIVIIFHAGALQYKLNPVFYCLELVRHLHDRLHRNTHRTADGNGGHHILIVMSA